MNQPLLDMMFHLPSLKLTACRTFLKMAGPKEESSSSSNHQNFQGRDAVSFSEGNTKQKLPTGVGSKGDLIFVCEKKSKRLLVRHNLLPCDFDDSGVV